VHNRPNRPANVGPSSTASRNSVFSARVTKNARLERFTFEKENKKKRTPQASGMARGVARALSADHRTGPRGRQSAARTVAYVMLSSMLRIV
jgi:hypothetical protein